MHTLKSLTSVKDPTPHLEKTGAYRVQCDDCESFYIGQTCRSFEQHRNDHLDIYNKNDYDKSSVARHLFDHFYDPNKGESIQIIRLASKGVIQLN